ncbi:MAG: hypothetical protein QCI38_04920 [Candidatus Thermoplasmatota archaeon]|nr:hypothetical protein [Candidatus Thermoplasmatota archaeon]
MHSCDLLEVLQSSGLYVFTPKDVARILGVGMETSYVTIHRMKTRGMVYPVEKGKFSICDDPFVVATQLVFPSYISFITALYLHGRIQQTVNDVFVVVPKKKRELSFLGTPIRPITFPASRMFGYRKVEKGSSHVLLADLEKAAVDSLCLPRLLPISILVEALRDGFDAELLESYAKAMGSEAVSRRAGFILELLGENTKLKPTTHTVYKLNPSISARGRFVARWKLYVNEVI